MRSAVAPLLGALAVVLVVALGGCGSDDGEAGGPTTTEASPEAGETATARGGRVEISADPSGEPAFVEESAEVRRGETRFRFRNPSDTIHSLCIESAEHGALGCTSQFRSDTSDLRLTLEPGDHTFYCNVPSHREAGMEGPLTVR